MRCEALTLRHRYSAYYSSHPSSSFSSRPCTSTTAPSRHLTAPAPRTLVPCPLPPCLFLRSCTSPTSSSFASWIQVPPSASSRSATAHACCCLTHCRRCLRRRVPHHAVENSRGQTLQARLAPALFVTRDVWESDDVLETCASRSRWRRC